MACAALKRSFDLDPVMSPQQHQSPAKRRRCQPMAGSSPISSSQEPSPFRDVTPKISRDALAANVYDEWRRIQKRRKIIGDSPPGSPPSSDKQPCSLSKTSPFHSANTSPFHNTATSPFHNANSLPFHSANHQIQNMPFFSMSFGQQQQQQLQVPHQQSSSNSSSTVAGSSKKQPTFTMKQVVLLCERLWKEREEKLREEYNQVLNARLSEQYDAFLKFTQDQIMRKYQEPACSYVS